MAVLEALLWRDGNVFAISEHGARSCIYSEGEAIVRKHKATPEEVAVQLNQYRAEGMPANATFDGQKSECIGVTEYSRASNCIHAVVQSHTLCRAALVLGQKSCA